ncbi:ClpX C4-type zinc finger protein [Acrocarpospora catenulata]|uniref:ClpX C4-type zinc finger protein n=1 Tax=Acrocarpospora catenulata TaxID=2836182 RepID=UPI001BDAF8D0|nr:ClpX C4-type zinc finger protein [Acrocarpospora catenulata]
MPAPTLNEQDIRCSFCGKPKTEVPKMVAGAGVFICSECVALCTEVLGLDQPKVPWPDTMTDEEILDHLPRIAAVGAQVDADLKVWVGRLRDRGVTWARIGAALGMTRQSAWEKFSGEE